MRIGERDTGGQMYEACPVCNGRDLAHLWQVNSYTIGKCSGCSLVFVQERITAEDLQAHYAIQGDSAYDPDNVECLNFYYTRLRQLIERRYPNPGKLLDVGCSGGWFLDVMRGWDCHGNEIVESDAEIARRRYGDAIVSGSFEDYPLREDYFDVITLQDVFDHIPEPVPALQKCHRMLKPGGLIVIKVHNISCLYAKLSGKSFYAIIPPSHLFYYNKHTLTRVLSSAGFETVEARFIGHLLKVRTVFSRLSRGNADSLAFRLSTGLAGSWVGELKFRKNLHDIITVLAVKRSGPSPAG
jgi:2-polyprenyl-3-methyl-5-hydroxy-6-metoxy-1,4-benzoquinol methylase